MRGGSAAKTELVSADGAGEVPVSEFENGASLVVSFAPLKAGGKFRTFLAFEILNEGRFAVGKQFAYFGGG